MRGTLIFDGQCGFCTRSRDLLERIDRASRITFLPLQDPEAPGLAGCSREHLVETLHWVDGDVRTGAAAVNAALSTALGIRAPNWLYRVSARQQEWLYRLVANNRYRLPGATAWCNRRPADCQPTGE